MTNNNSNTITTTNESRREKQQHQQNQEKKQKRTKTWTVETILSTIKWQLLTSNCYNPMLRAVAETIHTSGV